MSQLNDTSDARTEIQEQLAYAIGIRDEFDFYEQFGVERVDGPDGRSLHTTAISLVRQFDEFREELSCFEEGSESYEMTVDEMVGIAGDLERNYF